MWRLVLTVSLLCCSSEGSVTCRDENNGEVDWYILYKTPKIKSKALTGLDYIYIYPDQSKQVLQRDIKNIADPKGVLANTLQPLFDFKEDTPSQDFGFISYNDDVPEGYSARVEDIKKKEGSAKDSKNTKGASASEDSKKTSGGSAPDTFGHSKGVVMVQKDNTGGTGVWLLHSTPKFPYKRDKDHFWPESGTRNAQTFICVTFNYNQFKRIGEHLQRIRAFPFESHFPQDLNLNELHDVAKIQNDNNNHNTPANNKFPAKLKQLKSSGGKDFYSIAKRRSADGNPEVGDLYVSISKEINSSVNVQTWGCQTDRDGSFCSDEKVQNILFLNTDLGEWDPGSDHSKWCVAVDQNKPWTCIADVNRSWSQYERLGGALCIKDEEVAKIFGVFAKYKEKCPDASGAKRRHPSNSG